MSTPLPFNQAHMAVAAAKLEAIANNLGSLNKSFSAGTPGAANMERTGLSAVAYDDVSSTLQSITLKDDDFLLTKEIQTIPAKQTLHQYVLKTNAGSDIDVWGMENMLPQENAAQYMRVAEVIKVMGIRKSITHLAQQVNDVGGYMLDLEAENEENALITLNNSLERALYNGGDSYIDASGNVDTQVASNPNGPVRVIRGIQAQIREGNVDSRGIIGDFIGYANNRSTVIDNAGQTLTRNVLDDMVTAVNGNKNEIEEIHSTQEQMRLFRSALFPMDRGDVGASYAIRGSDISTVNKKGFDIGTSGGPVRAISTVFKFEMIYLIPQVSSTGISIANPGTPSASQSVGLTSFKAGEIIKYRVQACSVNGRSDGSAELSVTILADGNNVTLTIPAQSGVEYFRVYRLNSGETTSQVNKSSIYNHRFIGNVVAARQGSTLFTDAQAILPGLDSMVFLPKKEKRTKLAAIGPRVSRIDFGIRGLAQERGYVSYVASILEQPRAHGLLTNVAAEFKV
jgi:hypothetical protein